LEFNIPQLQFGETTVTPFISTWNSLHSKQSPRSPTWWYESDLSAGFNIEHGNWALALVYNYYGYPGGGADSTFEVGATLAYDDSEFTDKFIKGLSLNPSISVFRELNRSGNLEATNPGTYLGLEPSRDFEIAGHTITVSTPLMLGMGFDGYYGNQTFGYASAGLNFGIPLTGIKQFGDWTLELGVAYQRLLADTTRDSNEGRADVVVGRMGIVFKY
jgi:hypothetical protein